MDDLLDLQELSKEDLIKMIDMYSKNWLAIDGTWFQAVEKADGMEKAIEMDENSWKVFTVVEARRIMKEFDIPPNSGLDGLEKALKYRMYSRLNKDVIERPDDKTLIYKMMSCRVQAARERKNMEHFPCKSVGIIEYSGFASTIDPRIKTEVIACPPDDIKRDYHCAWKFVLTD